MTYRSIGTPCVREKLNPPMSDIDGVDIASEPPIDPTIPCCHPEDHGAFPAAIRESCATAGRCIYFLYILKSCKFGTSF